MYLIPVLHLNKKRIRYISKCWWSLKSKDGAGCSPEHRGDLDTGGGAGGELRGGSARQRRGAGLPRGDGCGVQSHQTPLALQRPGAAWVRRSDRVAEGGQGESQLRHLPAPCLRGAGAGGSIL